MDAFKWHQPDWVAVTNSNYSYTRMTLHNHTHVTLQQISIDLVIIKLILQGYYLLSVSKVLGSVISARLVCDCIDLW